MKSALLLTTLLTHFAQFRCAHCHFLLIPSTHAVQCSKPLRQRRCSAVEAVKLREGSSVECSTVYAMDRRFSGVEAVQ